MGESEKVEGLVSYDVRVTCPHCKRSVYLNQDPYDDTDENLRLGSALFGGKDTPAQWDGLDLKYECCHCKKGFVVNKLAY